MINHTSEKEKRHSPGAGVSVCNWEREQAHIHRRTLRAHQTGLDNITPRVKTITHERQCKCDTREILVLASDV